MLHFRKGTGRLCIGGLRVGGAKLAYEITIDERGDGTSSVTGNMRVSEVAAARLRKTTSKVTLEVEVNQGRTVRAELEIEGEAQTPITSFCVKNVAEFYRGRGL